MEGNQSTMSTNDDQTLDNSVQPSDDTQPQRAIHLPDEVAGAQSRRKFLRTAVISGVAVATVGATAGVAAAASANGGPTLLSSLHTKLGATSSPNITCSMCFEASALQGSINSFSVSKDQHGKYNTQPGTFFVWFTAHNVPDGNYVITISRYNPTAALDAAPFQYQSGGNNAFLYNLPKGTAQDCPSFSNHVLPTTGQVRVAATVPHLFTHPPQATGPYQVTGGPVDLQVTGHISWRDTSPLPQNTTYYFTGSIFSASDLNTPLCTATTHVLAVKNY